MKKSTLLLSISAAILALAAAYIVLTLQTPSSVAQTTSAPASRADAPQQAAGLVTMIDLGATECVPCKMMAPILEELKKEYEGRANIHFIDVWKDPSQAKKYGIKAIPTQIFFDAEGKEVQRHVGFLGKKEIVAILTRLGAS